MSNVKISQLPAASTFSPAADVAPIVHSGVTQKATLNQIVQAVLPSPGAIGSVTPNTAQFAELTLVGASGLQKAVSGLFTDAIAGTDYLGPTTGSAIQKANGTGGLTNAISGTDYAPATSGTSILYGNGAGGFSNVTVGSGLTFNSGTLASTSGGGSVTTVSVVTANGLAGTVADPGSTPAITLSTTRSGILYGNSGSIDAVTIGSGLTFASGTLAATAGGTVTDVSVVSANGFAGTVANSTTTPAITLSTSVTGLLKGNGTAVSAAVAGTDYAGLASANTFTNNQVISVSSASGALRITQTGAGNALVVEDSTNPDASPFVVDGVGQVIVGKASSQSIGSSIPHIQLHSTTASPLWDSYANFNWSAGNQAAGITLAKSRSGTVGTLGQLISGDNIGHIAFYGDDGASFIQAASIVAAVDGTPGTNDMPGRLVFSTTADGASSPTERMRIDNAGRVGVNGALTSSNYQFQIGGTIISAGTASYGFVADTTVPSASTSSANLFYTALKTQAAAFTLGTATHFSATQGAIGAGSSIINQYGFIANNSLTGATNNYGFYSNIASGTGRWNFYANGSADNYFAGAVTIDGTATLATGAVLNTPASGTLSNCTVDGTSSVGFRNIPQVSQSANYTTVLSDSGKHIFHPSTDTNARTFTIDSNTNVAYPVGTAITFVNMSSSAVTIAITSDTMYLAATGTTGSRTLAQYGTATALKIASTTWLINGNGLT